MEGWPRTFWVNQGRYSTRELQNLRCALWLNVAENCAAALLEILDCWLPSSWNGKLLLECHTAPHSTRLNPGHCWNSLWGKNNITMPKQQSWHNFRACVGRERWMENHFSTGFQSLSPKICVELYTSLLKQFKLCAQILRSCSLRAEVWGLKAFGCISEDNLSVFWVLLVGSAAVIYLFIWIAFALLQWLGVMTDYISVPPSYKFVGQKDKDLVSFF